MPLAQGLFEGVVELLGLELGALLQIELHQLLVHFDHLIDDLAVGLLHAGEVRTLAGGLEEAVDDVPPLVRRQVDGQALGAEGVADLGGHRGQVHPGGVDLVDHDHPAEVAIGGGLHHALGDRFDAGLGVDDHGGGLDRGQYGDAAPDEVREPGGVDQVDVLAGGIEAGDAHIQGVQQLLLQGIEVAHGGALVDPAGLGDGVGGGKECLDQGGLARAGMPNQGDVADVLCVVVRHR